MKSRSRPTATVKRCATAVRYTSCRLQHVMQVNISWLGCRVGGRACRLLIVPLLYLPARVIVVFRQISEGRMRKLWIGGAQACQGRDKLCKWTNNMLHEITDTCVGSACMQCAQAPPGWLGRGAPPLGIEARLPHEAQTRATHTRRVRGAKARAEAPARA